MVTVKELELERIQAAVKEKSGVTITEKEAHVLKEAAKQKEKK